MPSDTPTVRPTFRTEPVVAQGLGVNVINLITGVVHMDWGFFRSRSEEQTLIFLSAS